MVNRPTNGTVAAAAFAKHCNDALRVTIGGAAAPVARTCATRYCTRTAAPRGTRCGACNQAVYRLRWMKRGECVRTIQSVLLKLERIRMAVGQT